MPRDELEAHQTFRAYGLYVKLPSVDPLALVIWDLGKNARPSD